MPRDCLSCGSRSNETPFPQLGNRCCDCIEEAARGPIAIPPPGWRNRLRQPRIVTRASYRAAYRRRNALAQRDLVDMLVLPP